MSITDASFNINLLNENVYELTVHFKNDKEISNKKFIFSQNPSVEEGSIVDVFTKNGKTELPLKKLFKNTDVNIAKKAKEAWQSLQNCGPTLATFDLKDAHQHYFFSSSDNDKIEKSEIDICEFFKNQTHSNSKVVKDIHHIFTHTLPLDFILCEGTLKKDILLKGGLEAEEIQYLNSSEGSIKFCQVAEYFMNGFKLGQTIQGQGFEFLAEKYIKPISTSFHTFQPHKISTVIYPEEYKKIYSTTSAFAQTYIPIMNLQGVYCEKNQTLTVNYEMKV